MAFQDYIKSVRASGRYAFTSREAMADLGISNNALNCAIYKLKRKKELISPARNLYVIIPPEYQSLGCLPAEELVPILMKHWKVQYYVCGLSAAYYYGASHQKVQTFHVMAPKKQLQDIEFGQVKIIFTYKQNMAPSLIYVQHRAVKTGHLAISLPELTAMDLLTYQKLGGLNLAVTVLSELIEEMEIERLLNLIKQESKQAWWQRLGYILEALHPHVMDSVVLDRLLFPLREYAKTQSLSWVALAPSLPEKGMRRDSFWRVVANTMIEVDE